MAAPSSNWAALKKKLDANSTDERPAKRRKLNTDTEKSGGSLRRLPVSKPQEPPQTPTVSVETRPISPVNGDPDSVENLRAMVLSKVPSEPPAKPTNFIAVDCEMVGVGPDAIESALARVSIVNYSGGVVFDEYVRPQEPITDYRTWVSGIRPEHMVNAKSFKEVQEKVAKLFEGRFLVGHALHNDLSALLLTHPYNKIRDTQQYAPFRSGGRNSRPALRKLVQKELGLNIQEGEHSSLVDARATMALYRLHKNEWEASKRGLSSKSGAKKEQKRNPNPMPRNGISSGIATVLTTTVKPEASGGQTPATSRRTVVKAVKGTQKTIVARGGTKIKDIKQNNEITEDWWRSLE